MKAVVLETREGWAAVLREDGVVEKLRRRCEVGETIDLDAAAGRIVRFRSRAVKWVAAAVAAVVLFTGGGYGYNNAYAYSYVTLEVNPSLEYILNRRNRVLRVEANNEDAEPIAAALEDAGIRSMTLTDAIAETTRLLYENDYLGSDDESSILIDIASRGEAQEAELTAEVDAYFSRFDDGAVAVYVASGGVRGSRNGGEPAAKSYTRIGGAPVREGSVPPDNGAAPGTAPGSQPGGRPTEDAVPGSVPADDISPVGGPNGAAIPEATPDDSRTAPEAPNTANSGEPVAAPSFASPMRVSAEPAPPSISPPIQGHAPNSFWSPVDGGPAGGVGMSPSGAGGPVGMGGPSGEPGR